MADDGTVTITIGGAVDSSLTASATAAKSSLIDLAASGEDAGDTLSGSLSEGFKSSALAALRTAGEVTNLGDKLSSNDIVGAASEVAGIAASFSELNLAALGPVGVIAAVAGALAYLGERAVQSANDMEKIELSGLGTKGFAASKEQIDEYVDRLDKLPEVSSEDARQVVLGFQTMENRSQASLEGLSAATKGWSDATGKTLQQAGDQLREVFGAPLSASAEEFIEKLRGVTQAQIDEFEQARQAGNIYGAQKAMLEALGATIDASRGKFEAHSASIKTNWRNSAEYIALLEVGFGPAEAQNQLNKQSKDSWDSLATAVLRAASALGKMPKGGVQQSTPNLDAYIGRLQVAASLAAETASQRRVDSTLIEAATAKLRDQGEAEKIIVKSATQARDILGGQADAIAKLAAQGEKPATSGARGQDASRAREQADKIIAIDKQTNDAIAAGAERTDATNLALGKESLAQFVIQEQTLAKAKYDADVQAAKASAAAGRMTHAELIAQLLLLDQEYANKKAQIDDRGAEKAQAANDRQLSEFQRLLEENFKLTEDMNQRLAASGKISTAQKLADDISALNILKGLDDAAFAAATATMNAKSDAYGVEVERRNAFDKWYYEQVNTLSTQQAADEIAQWRTTDQAIESAESQLIGDIFSKRQGLGRDLQQIGLKLLEQEIQDDAKALTDHILTNLGMLASDQKTGQEGALAHLAEWGSQQLGGSAAGAAGNLAKAGSGVGQAAQQAALTANTQALAALYSALTGHALALGTNTAATTADTGVTTTGTAATVAHTGIMTSNVAMTGANVAVTTAHVGVTGASAAATGANAIAIGSNTIATIANTIATWVESAADLMPFATGSDNIPYDMPAYIHKGEMIIPAHVASLVRAGNIGIGEIANLAAQSDLTPVDLGGSAGSSVGSRSSRAVGSFGDAGAAARGGDSYNMGGLHIHGFDLPSIAHNPAFQREAVKVMRNMHRNAARR